MASEPHPEPVAEPQPLPDFVVEAPKRVPEPVAPPASPQPVSALEPEPDPGPLPDYIVDPEAPPRERIEPKPAPRPAPILGIEPEVAEPDPAEPLIAGLGLAAPDIRSLVKDSGQDRAESSSGGPAKEPRSRPAPASSRKARRERSAEDPGDEPEAVSWMDGLSSRLSAYSLADEGSEPASQDGHAKPGDIEDEDIV